MLPTCFGISRWLDAPLHRIEALQVVGMPANQDYFTPLAEVSNFPFFNSYINRKSHLCSPTQMKNEK